jgi:hypothetical protein
LSFFDDADEPQPATRAMPRTAPRRRRTSGPGRRPPSDQQSIQVRRAIAVVALLIVVLLIALGVHSCQVSARTSALKTYADNVSSLIPESNQTGSQLFQLLSSAGGAGAGNAGNLQNQINQTHLNAEAQLRRAQALDVPDEMKGAQQTLLLTLQMRRDGIAGIGQEIQPALGTSTSRDAVTSIAAQMATFYASDVVYKNYTTGPIASALHAAGIAVGGPNGVSIAGGQFVPSLQWLSPSFIAAELHVAAPGSTTSGKVAPGLHGHSLDSVSVAGTTLQTGSSNTIPASPAPSFTLHFTNGGTNNESNVVCRVAVSGTNDSGQTVVPTTTAGQHATCNVKLSSPPPTGTFTVKATIGAVPGEKNLSNNSQSFPVTFQ